MIPTFGIAIKRISTRVLRRMKTIQTNTHTDVVRLLLFNLIKIYLQKQYPKSLFNKVSQKNKTAKNEIITKQTPLKDEITTKQTSYYLLLFIPFLF